MKTENRKQKHLTLEDRIVIETGLTAGRSMRSIAIELEKDPSTISKEVKKRRTHLERNTFNDSPNQCALVKECHRKNVCDSGAVTCQRRECRRCSRCNSRCPDFIRRDYHCPKLDKAPFVCNACKRKSGCRLQKAYYRAAKANSDYRTDLVETRRGINIAEEDLLRLDGIISPLIRQGQTPYMILKAHPEINLSEKTIYNYIDSGALSVKNIDLPRKVKYKIRRSSKDKCEPTNTEIYEGRTYQDFIDYMKKNPDTRVVEMDTVIGCEGSRKVLLTFHFNPFELMMAYIMDSKEADNVKAVFDQIEESIGDDLFNKVFSLILTDRGGEFQRPDELEVDSDGIVRTSLYYCDPMCSWQKPHCEKNHDYIRRICPKGSSFDELSQDDIDLMMSHINSTPRESLGGCTPLEMAQRTLPKKLLKYFALQRIAPDDITLTPNLMKLKD